MTAIGKEDLFGYAATLTRIAPEDGSGWLAEVPQLPGCLSDGETPEGALANVKEAIECWLAAALEDGDTPPVPRRAVHPSCSLAKRHRARVLDREP